MKAEAIATISRARNKPKELIGKGLTSVAPKAWAKALSLTKLAVVLTKNVIINLTIAGSTPFTLIWSQILDVAYVVEYTKKIHLN